MTIVGLAQTNNVRIFCVAFGNNVNTNALQELTSETGGQYYLAATTTDLGTQFDEIVKNIDGQYLLRWATLQRANQPFQPSFQVTYGGFTASFNTDMVYQTNIVVVTNPPPPVTNINVTAVPSLPYNPTSPSVTGDVRVGSLLLMPDADVGPQIIRLWAHYVPRYIREIQINYRPNYPCTSSLDSTGTNDILYGWTMTETTDTNGLRTLTMVSPDTNNLLTSIEYGAFGDLVEFDFTYPDLVTATQAFSVFNIITNIYTNMLPSGQSFTLSNATSFITLYTNAPLPHGTPIPWLIYYGFKTNFAAAELIATNGLPVWEDYLAGLNPTNVNSRFTVAPAFAPGQTPQIIFSTVASRTYRVETSTPLGAAGPFCSTTSPELEATSSSSITGCSAGSARCFIAWRSIDGRASQAPGPDWGGLPWPPGDFALLPLLAEPAQDAVDLRGVHVQTGLGPDQVIGGGHLLFDGPLGLEALLDLFGRPAAGPEALLLRRGGTGDTDSRVQLGFGFGLEQERNHHDGQRTALRPARSRPGRARAPGCGDGGSSSSRWRAAGSAKTRRASSSRRSWPSGPAIWGPKAARTSASAGWPGSTTWRAKSSVSTTGTPRARKSWAEVDLPMPMPPVRPRTFMATVRSPSEASAAQSAIEALLGSRRGGVGEGESAGRVGVGAEGHPGSEIGRALDHVHKVRLGGHRELEMAAGEGTAQTRRDETADGRCRLGRVVGGVKVFLVGRNVDRIEREPATDGTVTMMTWRNPGTRLPRLQVTSPPPMPGGCLAKASRNEPGRPPATCWSAQRPWPSPGRGS